MPSHWVPWPAKTKILRILEVLMDVGLCVSRWVCILSFKVLRSRATQLKRQGNLVRQQHSVYERLVKSTPGLFSSHSR